MDDLNSKMGKLGNHISRFCDYTMPKDSKQGAVMYATHIIHSLHLMALKGHRSLWCWPYSYNTEGPLICFIKRAASFSLVRNSSFH